MTPAKWQNIKKTLSAVLDLPENERNSFLASESDTEIRAEVEKLLIAHEKAEDFIAQPFLVEQGLTKVEIADDLIGKRIENYLILERIGTGGMGAVYLAEKVNSDFKQKVAVKVIKRGMDSEAILKRFATERRILSSLKHPNIAQLLDGGISADGLPFFVMEYVDGKPLNEFCDENYLSLNERLEIFSQICSAVEYAHKNLIVHRDLKPKNIIVNADGVPKLLDFGIAKLLFSDDDSSTAITLTQGRMFTPEYASPEQILGKNVTTATDVYSLGIILYELLTGTRPYDVKGKAFDEIVKDICETEPNAPSYVWREAETKKLSDTAINNENLTTASASPKLFLNPSQLKGDLDNIVLKSLRKDPVERYGSVQQFAEDISRFLKGLPILARPQTLKYRFEKYVKRHKAGVLAIALAVVSLIGGSSIATWQAIEARQERAKAEQRFKDVRQLANSIVFEFHDSIEKLPGSTPSRELLIRRALEYLDKLADEAEHDLSLQMELADAYEKIGDIQGGFNVSNLGQREKSFESYNKALSIRENLVEIEPSNVEFRRKLASTYRKLGGANWVKADVAEGLDKYRKAFEINRKLNEELPNDSEIRYQLAMTQGDYGQMLFASGDSEGALSNTRQAQTIMEQLTANEPDNERFLTGLALCFDKVAEILAQSAESQSEARDLIFKSQEISLRFLARNPQAPALRRAVAVGYYDISNISAKLNDNKAALENAQKSLAMFEQLLTEDPQNEEFRQIVATVETELCASLIRAGKAPEAITRLNKSLAVLQKLTADSPSDEIARFRIAVVYEYLGKSFAALTSDKNSPVYLTNLKQSREFFQKSFDIYKDFRDSGKTVGDEAAKVDEIAAEIAKCNEAIAKLTAK